LLNAVIIHQGQYPLYDVDVTFAEIPRKAFEISGENITRRVGNMVAGLPSMTIIRLPHHGKDFDFDFNIYFIARNGSWRQVLSMRRVGDGWATATIVMRGKQELHRQVSANFLGPEPGIQDTVPK
jgi:hypothetical protein